MNIQKSNKYFICFFDEFFVYSTRDERRDFSWTKSLFNLKMVFVNNRLLIPFIKWNSSTCWVFNRDGKSFCRTIWIENQNLLETMCYGEFNTLYCIQNVKVFSPGGLTFIIIHLSNQPGAHARWLKLHPASDQYRIYILYTKNLHPLGFLP